MKTRYPSSSSRTIDIINPYTQKAVRKEAEHLFKMFRAGEKLTTDDILLLQRSKLI
jgi:uncharacterized coiled-coil DUF342 family protein